LTFALGRSEARGTLEHSNTQTLEHSKQDFGAEQAGKKIRISFPKYPVAKMPFKRFVEIGRITVLQDGPHEGKIAAIVDVIDQNRVLLDGPCSGVERQEYRIKNLHLTPLKITFPFSARSKVVRKAWEDEKVTEKWAESGWSKRMVMKARRQGLNDFDRFKLMKAKSARNKILAKAVWVGLSLSLFIVGSHAISLRKSGINSTELGNSTKLDFWEFFEFERHKEDDLEDIMFGPTINDPVCGVQRFGRSRRQRIVGGYDAGFGTFPWQVLVTVYNGTYNYYNCGGALVDRQHVVTAGHCVDRFADTSNKPIFYTEVHLGEYNRSTENEPLPMQWRIVDKIYVHPYYRLRNFNYDVAVIKFDRPIQYANHIVPICLPEKTDIVSEGTEATVSGWGKTDPAVNDTATILGHPILQAVDVKVIDNKRCQDWHREQGLIQFTLEKDQMCAGHQEGEKDTCQGDSGGPLMIKGNNGKWFLIGVVSSGYGCGERNQPGQFHRVGISSDWISFVTRFLLD